MTQSVTSGLRDTGTAQSGLIPTRYVNKVLDQLTDRGDAFTFIARLRKEKPTDNPEPKSADDLLLKNIATVATAYAAGATSIVVDSGQGAYFASRSYVVNKTRKGGRHLVISVSTDTLTVLPNADNGTSVAGQVGDELLNLCQVVEEAGPIPVSQTTTKTEYTWYCGMQVTSLEFSWLAEVAGSWFDPKDYPYQKTKRFMREHLRNAENLAIWGGKGRSAALNTTLSVTLANLDPDGVDYKLRLPWGIMQWHDTYADDDHKLSDLDLTEHEWIENEHPMFYGENEPKNKDNVMLFHTTRLPYAFKHWNIGKVRFEGMVGKDNSGNGGKNLQGFNWVRMLGPDGAINMKSLETLDAHVNGQPNYYMAIDTRRVSWQPYKQFDRVIKLNCVIDRYMRRVDALIDVGCPIIHQPNAHVIGSFITTSW